MNKEQSFFIEALNCYINNKEIEFVKDINWETIYKYAKMQDLTSVVFQSCKKVMPGSIKPLFMKTYASNVVQSRNRNLLNNQIQEEFNKENISYFFVKGGEICNLYYNPEFRTMGDTDIVVKKEEQEKASNILVDKLGFNKTIDGFEWVYFKNNLEFELHNSLVYEKDEFQGDFFNDCWKHVYKDENNIYHLDWNFHLLFLLVHIRKHIRSSGIGFRQFLDVAFVCLKKDIDYDYIAKKLKELDLYKFGMNVFILINEWFNINTPLIYKEVDKDFVKEVTEKVFIDGTFGSVNEENAQNQATNIYAKDNNALLTRFKYFIKSAFPSKNKLKALDYLSWMKKINYFLPLAWIYRLIHISTCKWKRDTFFNNITIPKEEMKKRKDIIDKWGL